VAAGSIKVTPLTVTSTVAVFSLALFSGSTNLAVSDATDLAAGPCIDVCAPARTVKLNMHTVIRVRVLRLMRFIILSSLVLITGHRRPSTRQERKKNASYCAPLLLQILAITL